MILAVRGRSDGATAPPHQPDAYALGADPADLTRRTIKSALTAASLVAMVALLGLGIGPRTGAYRTVTVLTGSMRPRIAPGSVVVVVPESPAEIRVGQVITYQAPLADQRVVTHRVIAIDEPGAHPVVQTKGDANNGPDPWKARIESPQVWRVAAVIPSLGKAIVAMRSPLARRLSLWLVPLLLAITWLREIWRAPKPATPAGPATGGAATTHPEGGMA